MNPVLMAALISGGINALQGKRGSDLLKSTVRDTAIAYALGPGMTGSGTQTEGINQIAQQATQQGTKQAATQMTASEALKQTGKTAAEKDMLRELAREHNKENYLLSHTLYIKEKSIISKNNKLKPFYLIL